MPSIFILDISFVINRLTILFKILTILILTEILLRTKPSPFPPNDRMHFLLCHQMIGLSRGDFMFFQRIKDLRNDNDLTQQEISDFLHMNYRVYSTYERGIREIPVWAVMKLADFYKTSTDYILGRTNNPNPPS